MPKFHAEVPHALGREAALERLHRFSERLLERHGDQLSGFEQSWDGDRLRFGFSTFGFRIGGTVEVAEDRVAVDGELPFAAAMFAGKIRGEIEHQLARLLGEDESTGGAQSGGGRV